MSSASSGDRYDRVKYSRCGRSGLQLPSVALGLWHNFGTSTPYAQSAALVTTAFESGITHFDIANNYGPPAGSAEETFGEILRRELRGHRDELIVSTKAGHRMWDGPYGDWGSRKSLIASLEQSLLRLGLNYVDIFYHHRPDPETPLEETMTALDHIVRSGKALYVGISKYYEPEAARRAFRILQDLGTPCLIHQVKYNMFFRRIEGDLLSLQEQEGVGCIAFAPMAGGLLTEKYQRGIRDDSRAAGDSPFLTPDAVTDSVVEKARRLTHIAESRGQSLAQMAVAWAYRHHGVTSVLIGASRPSHIEESVAAFSRTHFTDEELSAIDSVLDDTR